jgi:hypothetical protein
VLSYSTYLGGSGDDYGNAIALDASGKVYIAGQTASSDFPFTAGAYQTSLKGTTDNAFVAKFDPTKSGATSLVYSTYLGGTGTDGPLALPWTRRPELPTSTATPLQPISPP